MRLLDFFYIPTVSINKRFLVWVLLTVLFSLSSFADCDYVGDSKRGLIFPVARNGIAKISRDIDLQGKTYIIPEGVTLSSKGGIIKNGVLIGQNTNIADSEVIFDNVEIRGKWNVKKISTSLFRDFSKVNSLTNVLALASSNLYNEIRIEKNVYWVEAIGKDNKILKVPSNTDVIIDGIIMLKPNRLKNYSIVSVENAHDIHIKGIGTIIGDRDSHLDVLGEWGMCIKVMNGENITISGLNLKKAWGDGIYVGNSSRKIEIKECNIDSCRRQGISLISGNMISVKNCVITNISGTRPGYAIDIEPNKQDTITDVQIQNIVADKCIGGVSFTALEKNKCLINKVSISKCKITRTVKVPIRLRGANHVKVENCNISDCSSEYLFTTSRSNNVVFANNTLSTQKYIYYDLNGFENYGNKIIKGTKVPLITKKKVKSMLNIR